MGVYMPFKSEAQRRLFYAKEKRGELPKGTTARWEEHTPDKKLPEHVKKSSLENYKGYQFKVASLIRNQKSA